MAPMLEMPNLADLGRRYLAGETLNELLPESGYLNASNLCTRLLREGFRRPPGFKSGRPSKRRRHVPRLDDLVRRYITGESEKALADEWGITRASLRLRLVEAGIKPRNRSEGMLARMARTSADDRRALAAAAHAAVRGRRQSDEHLARRVASAEARLSYATAVELALAGRLADRGFNVTPQKAVGRYNVDVAINEPRIAVEVFGGNHHSTGRHGARHLRRTKYLLDEGWAVVIVWVDGRRYPLGIGCDEYIVALADELRRNPSQRRQYRVITGDGQPATIRESHLNSRPLVEALGCSD